MTFPAAIFLDWDGTLVDSYALLESAHNHTRGVLGFPPLPEGAFASYFGKPRDLLYNVLYPGKFDEAKVGFEKFYMANHLNGITVLSGVEDLLAAIADAGIICGVVTNKKASFIHEEITHLKWNDYFSAVVGAGDAAEDKPSPAPLQRAIEISGVKAHASEVFMVGDTENDLLCASRAGCKSVLILPPDMQKAVLDLASADFVFKNCQGFQEFLLHSRKKEIKSNNI